MSGGVLYVVGSPIGNLGDITLRALEILREVDGIYAEDTRVTHKLLERYEIKKPLGSFREAASPSQVAKTVQKIIAELEAGHNLAYLSDAGTPGVSDPGSFLVEKVTQAGLDVVPIPGPSALASILSVSGLPIVRPLFVGFLPKKKGHQTLMGRLHQGLEQKMYDGLVFYESPERIIGLLEELAAWRLPLVMCLGRELTKQFEEIIRGSSDELLAALQHRKTIKGEITLAIWLKN